MSEGKDRRQGQPITLETLAEQMEGVEKILVALARHTLTLSERHTRIVASLGMINTAPGLLIGLKEIATFLGLSSSTISRLRKWGFPTFRLGRHVLSHPLEILGWLRTVEARRRAGLIRRTGHSQDSRTRC